ncbi:hypothetical protein PybrP1_006109 [[Pythium] brassicae (nom. inval.)]|nr:hypothetical protein PybrP1_006109 [[Pythium] brassicae (nom. inval.)]
MAQKQQCAPPARATRSATRNASASGGASPAVKIEAAAPIVLAQSSWSFPSADREVKGEAESAAAAAHPHSSAATSSLAKFKAAQDLKIQTENLPPTPTAADSGATSCSSAFTTPGTDTSSCATPETATTPALPSSTGKKRRRRTAAQIDRKFACNYPGCPKAYGSEGSLTQHQRLKHDGVVLAKNKPSPCTQKQLGSYFPPLHQTARNSIAIAGAPSSAPPPRAPITLGRSIRPASVEGLTPPVSFDAPAPPGSGSSLLGGAASAPSSTVRQRPSQRSRSNSMPVSLLGPSPPPVLAKQASMANLKAATTGAATATRAQPGTRKSRASCTPRAKSGAAPASAAIRRGKSRSKSETLTDVSMFIAFGDASPLPPRSSRSASDSFVISSHHHEPFSAPMSISSSSENASAPIGATLHHSHSFNWSPSLASDSPASDQAIDSDILSVLADYDSSDMEDATEFANGGPLSSASFRPDAAGYDDAGDEDMLMTPVDLESYSFVPEPTPSSPTPALTGLRINDLFRRAEELGVGNRGVDLNRMSMLQQQQQQHGKTQEISIAHDASSGQSSEEQGRTGVLHSATIPMKGDLSVAPQPGRLEDFASVSVDAFTVEEVPELEPESMDICESGVKDEIFPLEILSESVGAGVAASLWKREVGGGVAAASSEAMTPLDLESAVLDPSSPTKRKAADSQQQVLWPKGFASTSCWTALEAQNQYVDELFQEAMAHERNKARRIGGAGALSFSAHDAATHAFPIDKLVGGGSLGELLFDVSEYGLEDTRMGSPLLCQQDEL